MTKREVASLAVRILALYMFVRLFASLPQIVVVPQWLSQEPFGDLPTAYKLLTFLGPSAVWLAITLLFWFGAGWLSSVLVRDDEPVTLPSGSVHNLAVLAFVIVGLVVLTDAVPRVTAAIANVLY